MLLNAMLGNRITLDNLFQSIYSYSFSHSAFYARSQINPRVTFFSSKRINSELEHLTYSTAHQPNTRRGKIKTALSVAYGRV